MRKVRGTLAWGLIEQVEMKTSECLRACVATSTCSGGVGVFVINLSHLYLSINVLYNGPYKV